MLTLRQARETDRLRQLALERIHCAGRGLGDASYGALTDYDLLLSPLHDHPEKVLIAAEAVADQYDRSRQDSLERAAVGSALAGAEAAVPYAPECAATAADE